MSRRGFIAIMAIGGVGLMVLMFMLQFALEKGYQIRPLVELKEDIERSFEVEDVRVFRAQVEPQENRQGETSERHWIVTQYRSRRDTEDDESLSLAILEQTQQQYRGDPEPVIGFRVKCLKPDLTKKAVKLIVENRKGPAPVQVKRSPGSNR